MIDINYQITTKMLQYNFSKKIRELNEALDVTKPGTVPKKMRTLDEQAGDLLF